MIVVFNLRSILTRTASLILCRPVTLPKFWSVLTTVGWQCHQNRHQTDRSTCQIFHLQSSMTFLAFCLLTSQGIYRLRSPRAWRRFQTTCRVRKPQARGRSNHTPFCSQTRILQNLKYFNKLNNDVCYQSKYSSTVTFTLHKAARQRQNSAILISLPSP